jgi:SAM-dependent methyltransferase
MIASIQGLSRLPDDVLRDWRERFEALGFDERLIGEAERIAPRQFDAVRLPLVQWALARRDEPGARLARLFVYDDAVSRERLEAILGAASTAALLDSGIVSADPADPAALRSSFRITPFRGLWILADDPAAGEHAVMGPGATTAELADLMPREGLGRCLDVGCGAGSFALLAAARGAALAVGTDIDRRAVAIARFNARLNGVAAAFVQADLVAPWRAGSFDLVIAQPPYVVQPPGRAATTFLHGGPTGEEISLRLLAGVPAVLAPGARALILADAAVRPGEPLHERYRHALGGAPVDLVVIAGPGASPDLQAVGYAQLEARSFDATYAASLRRYRDHLESLGVREFRHVLAIVRAAPRGAPDRQAITATLPIHGIDGCTARALDRYLAGVDLAARPDRSLATCAVRLQDGARWIDERDRADGGGASRSRIEFPRGVLACGQEVSEASTVLLGLLDGAETIEVATARYAEACEAKPDDVRGAVLDFVRRSLASGLLTAAGEGA